MPQNICWSFCPLPKYPPSSELNPVIVLSIIFTLWQKWMVNWNLPRKYSDILKLAKYSSPSELTPTTVGKISITKWTAPHPPSPPPPYISVYWLMCTWGAGGLQAITVMTIHTAANTLLTVLWHFCRNKLTVTTCCIGFKLPLVCQAGQVLCLLDKVQVGRVDCILWWFRQ